MNQCSCLSCPSHTTCPQSTRMETLQNSETKNLFGNCCQGDQTMRFHVSKSYIITKSYLNLFWNQRSLHVFLLQSSRCTPPHLSISRAPRSLQAPLRYSESTTFASTKSLVQDVKIHRIRRFSKICLSSKIYHTILKIHWRSNWKKRRKEESSSMDLEHIKQDWRSVTWKDDLKLLS